MPDPRYTQLAELLRERRAVIGDHAFRDADPAAHLEALKRVSEAIAAEHKALSATLPPMLAHCLERCSFDKALAFIEGEDVEHSR